MKITIDTQGLKQALDEKKQALHAATRPAAQAGAQVIYDLARLYVPVSKKGHWFYGTSYKKTGQRYWFDSGSLERSIYQVYSKDNSDESKSTYHISWNATEAPYAWMVEFGTSRSKAHPFMGPAIAKGSPEAAKAMKARFLAEVK